MPHVPPSGSATVSNSHLPVNEANIIVRKLRHTLLRFSYTVCAIKKLTFRTLPYPQ